MASDLPTASPGEVGVGTQPLIDMTSWVESHASVPIFSLLLSRHGQLVYELYTPGIERDEAHFMMSTTKSVTSAIVGAAVDRAIIASTDASIADLLPASLFRGPDDIQRFGAVSLKDAMGMSALDADEPPRDTSAAGNARAIAFANAPNRVAFALTQTLLPALGTTFQYNDVTPMLAGGAVQYATGKRLFDFGNETLFTPMAFKNAEWVQEDPTGLDLAAYGLRLRPMDMQKFGILFNNHGQWNGQQLLSEQWVSTTWTPYMHTDPTNTTVTAGFDNYGWYWFFRRDWGSTDVHWTSGWHGQYIVCIPAYDAVFSMTADIETTVPPGQESVEEATLGTLVTQYVMPALATAGSSPALENELATQLAAVHRGPSRVNTGPGSDPRMIPSIGPTTTPIPFEPR